MNEKLLKELHGAMESCRKDWYANLNGLGGSLQWRQADCLRAMSLTTSSAMKDQNTLAAHALIEDLRARKWYVEVAFHTIGPVYVCAGWLATQEELDHGSEDFPTAVAEVWLACVEREK